MWVCLNCHEYNDPEKEKCGKCENPRQQKEKPKGNIRTNISIVGVKLNN